MSLDRDWRWYDEDAANTVLPIWEKEKTAGYKEAFASKALQDQLGRAIQGEADRRLKAFFESLFNCEAKAVPREELQSPVTLGAALPTMLREMTPLLVAGNQET